MFEAFEKIAADCEAKLKRPEPVVQASPPPEPEEEAEPVVLTKAQKLEIVDYFLDTSAKGYLESSQLIWENNNEDDCGPVRDAVDEFLADLAQHCRELIEEEE